MLQYTSKFKSPVPIDGEQITVIVARLADGEFSHIKSEWNRITLRKSIPVERRDGEDALTDLQVEAKRLDEMTPEQSATYHARKQREEAEERAFIADAIRAYVSFAPGQVYDDGEPVTTGEQILRVFAAREDMLGILFAQVILENTLTDAQKKTLRLPSGSAPSSGASTTTTDGERPGPIAPPAELPAIAAIADAMVENVMTSSGTTALSS